MAAARAGGPDEDDSVVDDAGAGVSAASGASVFAFLRSMPPAYDDEFDELFRNVWSARAVFESLPSLAKQCVCAHARHPRVPLLLQRVWLTRSARFVMRMLFLDDPLSFSMLEKSLANPKSARSDVAAAIREVRAPLASLAATHRLLNVRFRCQMQEVRVASRVGTTIKLNATFQHSLRECLASVAACPWNDDDDASRVIAPSAELAEWAQRRWDAVLGLLVGMADVDPVEAESLHEVLLATGLVESSSDGTLPLPLTNAGYSFVLQDVSVQLWVFVRQFIDKLVRAGSRHGFVELIELLFSLGFCRVGRGYPLTELTRGMDSALSRRTKDLIQDLAQFGLVFCAVDHRGREVFAPTHLAVALARDTRRSARAGSAAEDAGAQGQSPSAGGAGGETAQSAREYSPLRIIVEKNFKVYAYTMSPLYVAILQRFVDVAYVLPNMAAGILTRESASRALERGITASQLVDFFNAHAHTAAAEYAAEEIDPTAVAVPVNVVDQLKLWESERNRAQYDPGVMLDASTPGRALQLVTYCRKHGFTVLFWSAKSSKVVLARDAAYAEHRGKLREFD